jgi:hypothetical protein
LVAEYAAVVSVGVESFDWRTQGDEWVHRVGECLAEIEGFSVTGHRYEYDGTTEPFIEFTGVGPGGATFDTRLVIIPLQEGIYVAIVGKAEEPDEAVAEAWAQAARCATARLGGSGTDFRWTAILAPPSPRIGGAEPTLEGDATVGVFRLVPVGPPLPPLGQRQRVAPAGGDAAPHGRRAPALGARGPAGAARRHPAWMVGQPRPSSGRPDWRLGHPVLAGPPIAVATQGEVAMAGTRHRGRPAVRAALGDGRHRGRWTAVCGSDRRLAEDRTCQSLVPR